MAIPIFYINLDHRTDRRKRMESQLSALGLNATRVSATTPDQLSAQELASYCDPTGFWSIRPNELACTISHMRVWELIAQGAHARALVLEDDAVLSQKLPAVLGELETLDYDLIRIEACWRARVFAPIGSLAHGVLVRPFRSTPGGASGYIISRDAAKRLLRDEAVKQRQLDLALYDPFRQPGRGLSRVLLDPALVIQEGDIAGADRQSGVARSDIILAGNEKPANLSLLARRFLDRAWFKTWNLIDHIWNLARKIETKPITWQ